MKKNSSMFEKIREQRLEQSALVNYYSLSDLRNEIQRIEIELSEEL
jgi:hypothetical protein